jgi:cell division protein FtsW
VQDEFGRLLVLGFIGVIGLQAAINIAVATVSMPTKGIALPFVSAGGMDWFLPRFPSALFAVSTDIPNGIWN